MDDVRLLPVAARSLAIGFLVLTVPIETMYSWRGGLIDPYYLVKVVGWTLLAVGAIVRRVRVTTQLALLTAGWAWLAANFWRAIADRFSRIAAGEPLQLESIELWFAGGSFAVCFVGLVWSLWLTARTDAR